MKKIFCDICGKEIKGAAQKGAPVTFTVDMWRGDLKGSVHWGEKEIDVCPSCVQKLCQEAVVQKKKDE